MKYPAAVRLLDSLVNYERQAKPRDRFKLDNIRRLLLLAGDPQLRMPRTILVAGTKGKGSTCYLLDAALRECGLKTGLFVSPHVTNVRERIQLGGRPVSPVAFAALVDKFRPLLRRQQVSYFELTAAMAFELFSARRLDYAVVEVGLGGRLDATNLSDPVVSVITRIGYDHVQVLGRTMRKIAVEKAGIMRPERPTVIAPQAPEAMASLAEQARKVGAKLISVAERTRAWDITLGTRGTWFSCFTDLGPGRVAIPLLGCHQIDNCLTALTTLGVLARTDTRIHFEMVRRGLENAVVPARCQVVSERPLILVDSCHNPESGRALADVIAGCIGSRVVLVYGSLRNKLVAQTVAPLAPWVKVAVLARPDSPRACETTELGRMFRRLRVRTDSAPDVPAAVERALLLSGDSVPVVVAGSFYVAGEALAVLSRRARHVH